MKRPNYTRKAFSRIRPLPLAVLALVASALFASQHAAAVSSAVSLSLSVPSATYLSTDPLDTPTPGNCRPGVAGVTGFGTVLPGTSAVTSADCTVIFGSSNDTASLRLYQADSTGSAMRRAALGTTGELATTYGLDSSVVDSMRQADGKIVSVGRYGAGANRAPLIVRALPDGSPDPTFGTAGRSIVDVDTNHDIAYAVAEQADGKLVVVGYTIDSVNLDFETFVLRLLPDGTLDPAFGTGGIVVFANTTFNDAAQDVKVQSNGRILVGGYSSPGGTLRATVVRLMPDGTLDASWGTGGEVVIGTIAASVIGMAIAADGSVVIAGRAFNGSPDSLVARFSSTGVLDTGGFGTGGYTVTDVSPGGEDILDDLVIMPDGRIVATGKSIDAVPDRDMLVMRYLANGQPDPSFDGDGIAIVDVNARFSFVGEGGIGLYPDGRILVGGASVAPGGEALTVARLLVNGGLDPSFGVGGVATTFVGTTPNRLAALILDADGVITLAGTGSGGQLLSQFDPEQDPRDFDPGVDDWSPGPAMFGGCLRSASAGAVTGPATWTPDVDQDCLDGDADPWEAIAPLNDAAAVVATAPSTDADARVDLRFGFRTPPGQAPGRFAAQLAFEVVAPG